jgi:hypothetical protein
VILNGTGGQEGGSADAKGLKERYWMRFLKGMVMDRNMQDDPVLTSAFGFGKRICPRRHFVNVTLFIMVASLFSVFNIERGKSGWGELSDYRFTGALVR